MTTGAQPTSDPSEAPGEPGPGEEPEAGTPRQLTRRATIVHQTKRLITAIRNGDESMVENAVLSLSQRSRWLAPLAFVVGAFAMLFQGVKLLVTNWRLTLVVVLPAMWIWAAMLDLKVHVLHGKEFHILRGPVLVPVLVAIAVITAASFYLNAVFAFAIADPGAPQIRLGFDRAREHIRTILYWGLAVGLALGFATMISQRWGKFSFALTLSVVVGVMMLAYVAVPARLVGVKSDRSTRDKLSATAIGGAIGALVCSPPYALGRVAIIMLGSHTFRVLAVIFLIIAVVLQTGATTATKAIKFSAKLITGQGPSAEEDARSGLDPATDDAAASKVTPLAMPAAITDET